MRTLKVYLSGCSDEKGYRKYVIDKYGKVLDLLDPMTLTWDQVNSDIGKNSRANYIVIRDKKLILESNIVVAYIKVGSTFGTTMEIIYAYSNGIPIYLIDETKKFRENPWVVFHSSKVFDSIDECFEHILEK